MDVITLILAISIPWLCGYALLALFERVVIGGPANPLRQIGYGLFLGYALLTGKILSFHALGLGMLFWPLLIFLGLTAAGAIWLSRKFADSEANSVPKAPASTPKWEKWLFIALVAWSAVHLILVAIEILYRPIFPWDAWLNWMYRAKAWFYAGELLPFDPPQLWAAGQAENTYNVAGAHYPRFLPTLALWCATALGRWSETLVNLPTLFAGIALWLAMFGQCREMRMPAWLAALAGWLLLSIPLIHTHLALAGQADIWMAAFVGLGFVALLRGVIQQQGGQIALGLLLVVLGIGVKVEGAVWFLLALAFVALMLRPRASLIALAALAAVIAIAWSAGVTSLQLPGGLYLGVRDGALHIPLLGQYRLMEWELADDYLISFLVQGSWHLLWPCVALAGIGAATLFAGRERRAILLFLVLFVIGQAVIFTVTEQGAWAEDWTAINRLPMHFVPALVFCLVLVVQRLLQWREEPQPGPAIESHWPGLIVPLSLGFSLAGLLGWLVLTYPGGKADAIHTEAAKLRPMVGATTALAGGEMKVSRFDNGLALLSSGPVNLQADDFHLLNVDLTSGRAAGINFFWRPQGYEGGVISASLPYSGNTVLDLGTVEGWADTITEYGLVFIEEPGHNPQFTGLSLAPYSLGANLGKLLSDWSIMTRWDMRSAHWTDTGAAEVMAPLPVVIQSWLAAALILGLLAAIFSPLARPYLFPSVAAVSIAGWMLLDIRWSANAIQQAKATTNHFDIASDAPLDVGDDHRTAELSAMTRETLGEQGGPVTVVAEDELMRFQVLRAKYLLLPMGSYGHDRPMEALSKGVPGAFLVLREWYLELGAAPLPASQVRGLIPEGPKRAVKLEHESEFGVLFTPQKAPSAP